MLQVPASVVEEMRELVASGDIKLEEERTKIRNFLGRATQLDDDKLLIAIAALSDDDVEELVHHVLLVEIGRYEVINDVIARVDGESASA